MTDEQLVDACVPIALNLVCVVRDEGPDAVEAALAEVPDGRLDALCVVLAAMVDEDRTAHELLAWTDWSPPRVIGQPLPREHGTERGYQQHRARRDMPACEPCKAAHRVPAAAGARRRRAERREVA